MPQLYEEEKERLHQHLVQHLRATNVIPDSTEGFAEWLVENLSKPDREALKHVKDGLGDAATEVWMNLVVAEAKMPEGVTFDPQIAQFVVGTNKSVEEMRLKTSYPSPKWDKK